MNDKYKGCILKENFALPLNKIFFSKLTLVDARLLVMPLVLQAT